MAKAEKRFSLRRDTPMVEHALVQALIAAGWKSSLMGRHKITARPMSKMVSDGGLSIAAVFTALLTWEEHPDRIDVLSVVTEDGSHTGAMIAACRELCDAIAAGILDRYIIGSGGNSTDA